MYPHTVTIEQKTQVPDGGGGWTTDWAPLKDWDCDVVPVGGHEYYVAQQMTNPVIYNINGDYDHDIKADMRVNFNGILLNIEAIIPTLPDINGDFELMSLNCSGWNAP